MTYRWLRIPPGVSYSKAEHRTQEGASYKDNEYLEAMVRITTDDICVSDAPFSVNYKQETPEEMIEFLEQINSELNSVCKWVTIDLLTEGYSIYDVKKNKGEVYEIVILPFIEPVQFYLTEDKEIICYGSENLNKIEDVLLFINYDKSSLELVDDVDKRNLDHRIKFKITPLPMQVGNVSDTIRGLDMSEKSMLRYRTQLSRVARWVNVDIGASQGDLQQSVIDSISSSINTNSIDLSGTQSNNEYDDNIPVIPNRRGIGKPEIVSDIPEYKMDEVPDIEYFLGKLSLQMRFPKSYLDFTKPLGETAVSLIRSDLRYYKLCSSVRTKIENTVNTYFSSTKIAQWDPYFSLTKLPSTEDDDVIEALESYVDLVIKIDSFINEEGVKISVRINRLEQLQNLLNNSTNSPMIQAWLNEYRDYLYSLEDEKDETEEDF